MLETFVTTSEMWLQVSRALNWKLAGSVGRSLSVGHTDFTLYPGGVSASRVTEQIQTCWRNKHLESHQVLFWSDGSRAQRLVCSLISLLLISLTAAVIQSGPPGSVLFCWLELEGNWTLLHEHNVTERRERTRTRTRVSAESWLHSEADSITDASLQLCDITVTSLWHHCAFLSDSPEGYFED